MYKTAPRVVRALGRITNDVYTSYGTTESATTIPDLIKNALKKELTFGNTAYLLTIELKITKEVT